MLDFKTYKTVINSNKDLSEEHNYPKEKIDELFVASKNVLDLLNL